MTAETYTTVDLPVRVALSTARLHLQAVDLVVDATWGKVAGPDLGEHGVHLRDALVAARGSAGVDHVQQQRPCAPRSVDWNAATSSCGSSRMNRRCRPATMAARAAGRGAPAGSSVANNWSAT